MTAKKSVRLPVLLSCPARNCHSSIRISKDDFMPTGTAEIRQFCPKHRAGRKGKIEYFDKDGEKLDKHGWDTTYYLS